ncbi:MAG: DUF3179 domain-containing protein [Acidimicrobiales bacterium]|nr:DUF3179 domain-containing protein [Acidimicrobiales bacterium]RZV48262.1 MAG: DUF3179 domain-containing protein [Acidimicrobiales bacterium]
MTSLFVVLLAVLIVAELTKGLSANGTPPVLQGFSRQMDLAYFMWSNIARIRIVLAVALIVVGAQVPLGDRPGLIILSICLLALWFGIYWLFNRFWVGRLKFPKLESRLFVTAAENTIDLSVQVVGVDHNGEQKAIPATVIDHHHQVPDEVGGRPMWFTYCGLCRSARVYDLDLDGTTLDFFLVGAVTYNAVFQDNQTGSWWRQETGEAVKGPLAGRILADVPHEHMSLGNWLNKYPDSKVLQYDPQWIDVYHWHEKMLDYEVSFPGWMMQDLPRLVLGLEVGDHARAYDFEELKKSDPIHDEVGAIPLLVFADTEGFSPFAYDRTIDGQKLEFERAGDGFTDVQTQSSWDKFGRCTAGALEGKELRTIQCHQQFVRSWIEFHRDTTFYKF